MYIRNRKQGRVLRYLAGITLATFLPSSVQAWEFLPSVTMVPVALEATEPSPPMLAEDRLDQLRQQLNTDRSPEAESKLARLDDVPKTPEPREDTQVESAESPVAMLESAPGETDGRVQLAAHTAVPSPESQATLPQPTEKQETEESERTFSGENRLALAKMLSEGELRPDKRREAMQQIAQVRVIRKSQPVAEPAAPNGEPPVAAEPATPSDSDSQAEAALAVADAASRSGDWASGVSQYLNIVAGYPGSAATDLAAASLEDFVDEVRQGKLSVGIISRVVQAIPELSTFTTGMGRTHALAVLRACAEGATSLGDRNNAKRYLKTVRDNAFGYLKEDRDDPFQLIYTRTYVDASNATGLEERAEARAELWSIIEKEPEHNMALFAARSELAMDMFRNGERAECGLQFANLREQFEDSSAARWRSDAAVDPFIRAQIALARAHADFQLAHLSTALEQFKAIAEEFADIREVSELASYLVAMTTYLANQGDPEAGIAAFEQYAKEHPGSWLLDKALYQLALRYHTNHDFEAASEVYLQLIQARPESDLAKHARGARADMIQRGELKGVKLSAASEVDPLPENWCGPVALAQLLRLHGVESELTELAKLSEVTATGATLLGLQKAAGTFGVSLIGVHAANLEEIEGPFIAHVNAAHFVLVEDVDATTVVLREASKEAQSISREDFIARWDGTALAQSHARNAQLAQLDQAALDSIAGGQGTFSDDFTIAGPEAETCENQNDPSPPPGCSSRDSGGSGGGGGGDGGQDTTNFAGGANLGPGSPQANNVSSTGSLIKGEGASLGYSGNALRAQQVSQTHLNVGARGPLDASFSVYYSNSWGKNRPYFEDGSKPYKRNIGMSWTHNFNAHVRSSDTLESLFYLDERGNPLYFVEDTALETMSEVFYFKVENETPRAQRAMYLVRDKSDDSYELIWPDGKVFGFSPPIGSTERYSRLEYIRDASYDATYNNELTFDYAPLGTSPDFGRLTRVNLPSGDARYLQLEYNGTIISKVALKESTTTLRDVTYAHDAGRLTAVTWDGNADTTITYGYTQLNHPNYPSNPTIGKWISSIADKNNNSTTATQEYTEVPWAGWVPTKSVVTHPEGTETRFERPDSGSIHRTLVRNYDGSTPLSAVEYDIDYKSYNIIALRYYKNPANLAAGYDNWPMDYQYTSDFWALTRARTPSGTAYAQYRYNSAGRMLSKKEGDKPWAYYEYVSASALHPTKFVASDGLITWYEYDGRDRLTKIKPPSMGSSGITYVYDNYGQVITMTDALGRHTRMEYDARGQLTKRYDPAGNYVRMEYDGLGQMTKTYDPLSNATQYQYEDACPSCGSGSGRLTKTINADLEETTMAYDDGGRLTSQTDALSRTTTYAYDDNGNLTQVQSPLGAVSSMEYDGLNRVTKSTSAAGKISETAYDYMGRAATATDGAGSTSYTYTEYGAVSTVTDGNSNVWTYIYTPYNELTYAVDGQSKYTLYQYDSAGRSTKVGANILGTSQPTEYFYSGTTGLLTRLHYTSADFGTSTIEYHYDVSAQLTRLDDWMGGSGNDGHFYEYDLAGRVTRYRDFDDNPSGTRKKLDYVYDAAGRVLTMTDYDGYATTYAYTVLGQVSTITAPGSKTWDFDYNEIGQRSQVTLPNGMTTAYAYDTDNRMTKMEHKDGATVVDGWSYGHDQDGSLLRVASAVSGNAQAWDYHHDDRGRLLNAVYRNPSGTPIYRHGYTYDAGDNLLAREKVAYEDKVVDDFSDNNYTSNPVWTPTLTWTAASGYLQLVDALGVITTPQTESNTETWFSYRLENTTDAMILSPRKNGSSYTAMSFKTTELKIYEGTGTLESNTSAADLPAVDTWYDVYCKAIGPNMEVWHGPQGGALRQVLSTTAAASFANTLLEVGAIGAGVRVDNIRVAKARARSNDFTEHFGSNLGSWTSSIGTWSATGHAMKHAVDGANWATINNTNTGADGVYTFRYRCDDTSDVNHRFNMYARFLDENNRIKILVTPTSVQVQQGNGGTFTTLSTTAVTTTEGDWYELKLILQGARCELWRAPVGGNTVRLLNTSSVTWLSAGDGIRLNIKPGAEWSFDDTRMIGGAAPASFADDFADGDYTSNTFWSTISSWTVSSGRMENTNQAGGSVFYKDAIPHTDGTLSFKYKIKGTSSAGNPLFSARFRDTTSGNRLIVFCYEDRVRLSEYVAGVGTILDTNMSWGTVADTEYEVSLVAEGNRAEVWMALAGQPKQRVLSGTTSVLRGDRAIMTAETGCLVSVDDISFTVPDPGVETFQYNNANELTRQVVDGFIQSFVYDDWGRMVTKTRGGYQAVYKYRFGDKLKQINTNFPGESAAQVEYTYDGLGRRRVMILGGTPTQWQRYDLGWNVLGEYAHGGSDWTIGARTNSYTWMDMTPLSETPGTNPGTGASQYYLHDHLGSTRDLFNASKAKTARMDYEPHGQQANQLGLTPGRTFTGKESDEESGLYHFPFRHYSPNQARWLQRDPLGMVDGPNVYAYVRARSIQATDRLGLSVGHQPMPDPGGGGGGGGGEPVPPRGSLAWCLLGWYNCINPLSNRGYGRKHCTICFDRCRLTGEWPTSVADVNGKDKSCGPGPPDPPQFPEPDPALLCSLNVPWFEDSCCSDD